MELLKQSHQNEMKIALQAREQLQQIDLDAYRRGEKNSLKAFLEDCNTSSTNHAYCVDGSQLSPSVRSSLSLIATGKPLSKEPSSTVWRPPKYENAENYVYDVCKAWKERFWMGISNGSYFF